MTNAISLLSSMKADAIMRLSDLLLYKAFFSVFFLIKQVNSCLSLFIIASIILINAPLAIKI